LIVIIFYLLVVLIVVCSVIIFFVVIFFSLAEVLRLRLFESDVARFDRLMIER